ncbi:methylenetetrahydrofolate--tRNA-(uracil(54)-C(5))-methyltransferase (FADH(2)-oxidizing) TrmFO [Calditerrivibrio nitroreducens]|uniref:Methylenetetrahydrofolate--tRNA-(uracil-5-)-methyltransferase TrmFO n=1 Tax=Calditerrivibrio nitroreducens (strain DSM 19672 / NBRC 101217 / Yu37-1) TaxID=768670 RepID=E4TIA3_CALNY|nr:methylenetetrahydrofolate--tRNA-(uracil(54)-C(5))-methyltransferase (FADH(2)-oxidizing) TrmFO [Calditerrivibrio nitroreducens]ADR19019.1 gid protein [Calditerrivibrio nitroreducens DSM 19672]
MAVYPLKNNTITIIGGGLAGSEAAFQLAEKKFNVVLYEMRPHKLTEAHQTGLMAELLCSNSLKSIDITNSNGLLKKELELMGSLLIKIAYETRIPAGNALSVDRKLFAEKVTNILENHPNITIIREEITEIPNSRPLIIATGPLTSENFARNLINLTKDHLFFYDAISPIVDADTINYEKVFFKSRYDKGDADYLNCPMTREEYEKFYFELINAEKVEFRSFEKAKYYENCIPIEELASRGFKTLIFGPMRPVGLENPITGEKYYAVVQLRKENKEGTAYNIVGFQTKMKIQEQKRVFRLIPGLENVEFLRYGSIHRNTYINAPNILEDNYKIRGEDIYFAGQISGVEGYVESIASGLTVAFDIYHRYLHKSPLKLPEDTALFSLQNYVSHSEPKNFSPSNFHFGMLSSIEGIKDKNLKKQRQAERALIKIEDFLRDLKI